VFLEKKSQKEFLGEGKSVIEVLTTEEAQRTSRVTLSFLLSSAII
jgi:hypothetical protein